VAVAYYISTISMRQPLAPEEAPFRVIDATDYVGRFRGVRSCKLLSSMLINRLTGNAGITWVICRLIGENFAEIDADTRCDRLAYLFQLDEDAPPGMALILSKYGLGGVGVFGTRGFMIQRLIAISKPNFRGVLDGR
jgi:hypothetical protein